MHNDREEIFRVIRGAVVLILFLSLLNWIRAGFLEQPKKAQQDTQQQKTQQGAQQQIRDSSIYAKDGNFKLLYYTTYTYDQSGNQTGCYKYNADGTLFSYEEKRYAVNGDWLQSVSGSQYGSKKTQLERRIYFSDVNGEERVTKVEYYEEGVLSNVTCNYFYDGKVAKLTAWLTEDGLVKKYAGRIYLDTPEEETQAQFEYEGGRRLKNFAYSRLDEKHRLAEQYKGKGTDDTVFFEKTYAFYDDDRRTSRQVTYWPLDHLNSYRDVIYSESGQVLSDLEYLHGFNGGTQQDPLADMRVAEGHWAEYDGEQLVSEMSSSWTELSGYTLYQYDDNGNVCLKFEYKDQDSASRKLHRYVYDENEQVKEIYTYSMGTEAFSFTSNNGIRYQLEFDATYKTMKTITSYYPEGNIKEQYAFLKQDWVHDNKMLWHDVYDYEAEPEDGNKAAVYRYDIEGNLLETLDGGAL